MLGTPSEEVRMCGIQLGGAVDTICSDTSLETDRCDEGQSMSLILWLPKRGYLSQPLECGRYSEDVY